MTVSLILAALITLGAATLLARTSMPIGKPAAFLVVLGVLGSIATIFGIEMEVVPHDPERSVRWLALIGTAMSFLALIGLLALVLIWAIRRWGIKHDDNPEQF